MKCRHCGTVLTNTFIDLGKAPPSNAYLQKDALQQDEKYYPLKVLVCEKCWLVQTEDFVGAEKLFANDYAYFSSYSTTWLEHARNYVNMITDRLNLDSNSKVLEIAANDGYLLQYVHEKGIPCYGIEPTHSTAAEAVKKGISVIEEFFSIELAKQLSQKGQSADLVVANNVLAHVPDINDFVEGVSRILNPEGVATFEFPHLLNLIEKKQFDTIYHEHYSYLSLIAVTNIFSQNGLAIFDVEEIPTHGGSLRVYAQRIDTGNQEVQKSVQDLMLKEKNSGLTNISYYKNFQKTAEVIKQTFIDFLRNVNNDGLKVAAYGAAAKGNTIINYSGVKQDLISYVVDKNPAKQEKYLPGSKIPIVSEEILNSDKPDYVLVLPWNISKEIMSQLDYIREWGGKFVTLIPELKVQ